MNGGDGWKDNLFRNTKSQRFSSMFSAKYK